MSVLGTAVAAITEALFPGRCLLCGGWLFLVSDHSTPICSTCLDALHVLREPRCARCGIELSSERGTCLRCRTADFMFHTNMSVFAYSGHAKVLLVGLKFEQRRRLAPLFATYVAGLLKTSGWNGPIIPVPPRPGRHTPDAVELVARRLERCHGLRVVRPLVRASGVQQKTLDFEQRKQNLRGRVRITPHALPDAVPQQGILLDDVFTTGATLDVCARALRDAGCAEVNAVTLVIEE